MGDITVTRETTDEHNDYRIEGFEYSIWLPEPIVHALIRLGMEAQRERSAKTAADHILHALAKFIRAQPIDTADILAALEKGNG
jgi:hypothetical protein